MGCPQVDLARSSTLKGLEESYLDVFNHLETLVRVVKALSDTSIPSEDRYQRAEAVAGAHTTVKDRHFPSEYYSTVFHADARRVRAALKARKLADAKQDAVTDVLVAIGAGELGPLEKVAQAAGQLSLRLELRAAEAHMSLMQSLRQAREDFKQLRADGEGMQRQVGHEKELKMQAAEVAAARQHQLEKEVSELKFRRDASESAEEELKRHIEELKEKVERQKKKLKDIDATVREEVEAKLQADLERMESQHQDRIRAATEWANREQDTKSILHERLSKIDREKKATQVALEEERALRRRAEMGVHSLSEELERERERLTEIDRTLTKERATGEEERTKLARVEEQATDLQAALLELQSSKSASDKDLRSERDLRERLAKEMHARLACMHEGEDPEEEGRHRVEALHAVVDEHVQARLQAERRATSLEHEAASVKGKQERLEREVSLQKAAWEEAMEEIVRLQGKISEQRSRISYLEGEAYRAQAVVGEKQDLELKLVRLEAEAEAYDSLEAAKAQAESPATYGALAKRERAYEEKHVLGSPVSLGHTGSGLGSPELRIDIPNRREGLELVQEAGIADAVDRVDAELKLPRINGVQPADDCDDMGMREVDKVPRRGQSAHSSAQKKRGVQPTGAGMNTQARNKGAGFMSKGRDREIDPFGFNQHPRNWQR